MKQKSEETRVGIVEMEVVVLWRGPTGVFGRYRKAVPERRVLQMLRGHAAFSRKGPLSAWVVMWLMIFQRLDAGGTLAAAVRQLLTGGVRAFVRRPKGRTAKLLSANTSAYSQARSKLPLAVVEKVSDLIFESLCEQLRSLPGVELPVFLLDGTSIQLQHSGELLRKWPAARNQHGSSHWSVIRVVVAHDVIAGLAVRPCRGAMDGPAAISEQGLTKEIMKRLPAGCAVLGDRNFGVFSMAWHAGRQNHPCLFRLTELRAKKLNGGMVPSAGTDRQVVWQPSRGDLRSNPEIPAEVSVTGRLLVFKVCDALGKLQKLYFFTTLTLPPEQILNLAITIAAITKIVILRYQASAIPQLRAAKEDACRRPTPQGRWMSWGLWRIIGSRRHRMGFYPWQRSGFAVLVLTSALWAQQPAVPTFDVVSIRAVPPNAPMVMHEQDFTPVLPGGRYVNSRESLVSMICFAYDCKFPDRALVGLPAWARNQTYAVAAKAEDRGPALSPTENREQVRLMMRSMLADRFHLRLHTEARQERIYRLEPAKGGITIKEVAPPVPPAKEGYVNAAMRNDGGIRMIANQSTMAGLANCVNLLTGRPVIDATGSKSYYSFDVKWTGPEASDGHVPETQFGGPELIGLLISNLRDQFGLRLTSTTGPVEYWIVDQVEPPTDN